MLCLNGSLAVVTLLTYPTPTVPTPCSFLASVYDRVHLLHLRLYCYISSTGCCKNQESCSKAYFFFLLELLYSFDMAAPEPPPPLSNLNLAFWLLFF